jgi:hypothetical protein
MPTLNDFNVGDRVYFGRGRGEKTLGEVVRKGRKNLKVKQLESRGTKRSYAIGSVWTVPPTLCRKADGSSNTSTPTTTLKVGQSVKFRGFSWEKRGVAEVSGVVTRVAGDQVEVFGGYGLPKTLSANEVTKRRKRSEKDILKALSSVDSSLSPENLTCDGELSRTAVRRKAAALRRARKALETELGRKMDDTQVWRALQAGV